MEVGFKQGYFTGRLVLCLLLSTLLVCVCHWNSFQREKQENQLLVAIHGSEMLLLSQHHLSSCWAYQLCCSALLGVKAMDPLCSRRWVIRPVLVLGLVSWCQGLTHGDNIPTSVSACYLLAQIASCRLKGRDLVQTELRRYQ